MSAVDKEIERLQKLIDDWDISGAIKTSAYWRLVAELERRRAQQKQEDGRK